MGVLAGALSFLMGLLQRCSMQSSHCCLVAFASRMQSDASPNHIRLLHALPNATPLCFSTSTESPFGALFPLRVNITASCVGGRREQDCGAS